MPFLRKDEDQMGNGIHHFMRTGVAMAALGTVAPGAEEARLAESYEKEILPIMVNHCYDCHGDGSKKGHLALDDYGSIGEMIADREEWQKIRDHIDFRLMPPPDEYAPSDEDRVKLVKWIDDAVFAVDPANPDPGHVTLRRLNRAEYASTIRDLLGVKVNTTEILPVDDSGYGFDNIGDVLTLAPLHMERYLEAAEVSLAAAVDFSPLSFPQVRMKGGDFKRDGNPEGEGRKLFATGMAERWVEPGRSGRYRIRVLARADQAGDELAKMELRKDGVPLEMWEMKGDGVAAYSHELELEGGKGFMLGVAYLNDFWNPDAPEGQRDRNLEFEEVVLEGPLDGPPVPRKASHTALFGKRAEGISEGEYMLGIMKRMIAKAFRRPLEEGEAERYMIFLERAKQQGESVETAIQQALAAVLVSPSFLFLEEPTMGESDGGKVLIGEHALATRLSYFLWSSMPDDQLRGLADRGELRKNLGEEIRRMMASDKSEGFVENFIGQWLQLRDMDAVTPNNDAFPGYERRLAGDMRRESELLVKHVMRENLPVRTLLEADFTFINEALAKHYGIEGVKGEEFRQVSLAGTPRRGLLGHASVLTLTSHPQRTSPVLRGKYILDNLLNMPPPPAPPNVPTLEANERHGKEKMTLRQELEIHRKDPACASCHALMDPIGFALENYDGIGRWRE